MIHSSSKPFPIFFLASKYTKIATLARRKSGETRNQVIHATFQKYQKSILKILDRQSCSFAKLIDSKVVGLVLSDP